jgi:hypothetical protein
MGSSLIFLGEIPGTREKVPRDLFNFLGGLAMGLIRFLPALVGKVSISRQAWVPNRPAWFELLW